MDTINRNKQLNGQITLPFSFYFQTPCTDFKIESQVDMITQSILKKASDSITEAKTRVALILVDVIGKGDDSDLTSADSTTKSISAFLDKCRKNAVTVVHAPNFPIVEKYQQYHDIRDRVKSDFCADNSSSPEYMNWPQQTSLHNNVQNLLKDYHNRITETYTQHLNSAINWDIHKSVQPLASEYVAQSFEELRYILWKEQRDILIFVGGGLRQCLMNRPIGINAFRGVNSNANGLYSHYYRTKNFICVLEDCIYNMGSEQHSSQVSKEVMLEYLGWNRVFISRSTEISFT